MAAIVWDEIGSKIYKTGTDRGVLYPIDTTSSTYPAGYAWNGLTGVSESPSGAEETALWADNGKYGSLYSAEEYGFTINAYQSPEEFDECDGTATIATGVTAGQQARKRFGFSWRTLIGNDVSGNDYGYEIHLVYGAMASPSEKEHSSVNDSPDAEELSWECTTVPVPVPGFKQSAHLVINSTTADAAKLTALEAILYGDDAIVYVETADTTKQSGKTYYTRSGAEGSYTYTELTGTSFSSDKTYYEAATAGPRLPLPAEVITLMSGTAGN
ncbi:MAG: hypothetical protein IJ087_17975 [Eggerthellaceae bacterium]|nr:hypothetical protein [Eggerthellaceae bacterium]